MATCLDPIGVCVDLIAVCQDAIAICTDPTAASRAEPEPEQTPEQPRSKPSGPCHKPEAPGPQTRRGRASNPPAGLSQAAGNIDWGRYKIDRQHAKLCCFVSIVSTRIPFKSAGKDNISEEARNLLGTLRNPEKL